MKKLLAVLVAVAMLAAVGYAAVTTFAVPTQAEDDVQVVAAKDDVTPVAVEDDVTPVAEDLEEEDEEEEEEENPGDGQGQNPGDNEGDGEEGQNPGDNGNGNTDTDKDDDEEEVDNTGVKYVASAIPNSTIDVDAVDGVGSNVDYVTVSGTTVGWDGENALTFEIDPEGNVTSNYEVDFDFDFDAD